MNEVSKELVRKYLDFHSSKSKETLKRYRSSLHIFMEFFPDKSWDDITVDDAIFFYNSYLSKVSKDTVVKRFKGCFKVFRLVC